MLVSVGLLLWRRPHVDTAIATVVADVTFGNVGDPRVVRVVNNGRVYVAHISVVGEAIAFPSATLVSNTAVAEAVIDAAVEPHLRSPISFMEDERIAAPGPITRSP